MRGNGRRWKHWNAGTGTRTGGSLPRPRDRAAAWFRGEEVEQTVADAKRVIRDNKLAGGLSAAEYGTLLHKVLRDMSPEEILQLGKTDPDRAQQEMARRQA